ncbi:MAG: hypothetical protein HZB76_01910 [Chlamydiae bacterium]|nr:hypothetical protein [Chlamydiota bacterium]
MYRIALFGEAEKGQFYTPYICKDVYELALNLGNPPEDSFGIHFAIQALMYEREVLFFRVEEEGFSVDDYLSGFSFLKNKEKVNQLSAICMPKVGSKELIQATDPLYTLYKSILITSEKDLFDYLSSPL